METVDEIKIKLRSYSKNNIIFNEPHFTEKLTLRGENLEEVYEHILEPDDLMFVTKKTGAFGDMIYTLYFKKNSSRTIVLPVLFDMSGRKSLYILTYILKYSRWESFKK